MRRRISAIALLLLLALLCAVALRNLTSGPMDEPASAPQPSADVAADAAKRGADPGQATGSGETAKQARRLVAHESGPTDGEGCGGGSICLRSLLRRQNEDGSWGAMTELFEGRDWSRQDATAMVLLSFLGAGYSPLSKDRLGDLPVGDAIRAGIAWLDVHPPADAGGTALVALALSEAAGLTGDPAMKESADRALARLTAWQCGDGRWDGDAVAARFSTMALASARIGDIPQLPALTGRAAARLRDSLAAGPDPDAAIQLLWLTREISDENRESVREACRAAPPAADAPAYIRWYFDTVALFQVDGPKGEAWKTWSLAIREVIIPSQGREGTWPGGGGPTTSAVRDSLAVMTMEIYYRYANAPAVKASAEKK